MGISNMLGMWNKDDKIIVATHGEDIDGIASVALILRVFPNATFIFTRPADVKSISSHINISVDLPKPKNCDINIDHHKSNYYNLTKTGNLTDRDLVDPAAISAAELVSRYFGLNDEISKQLVDMANRADSGNMDEKLIMLDLLIKSNVGDQVVLRWIVEKLSKLGYAIFDDPEFCVKLDELRPLAMEAKKIVGIVDEILKRGIKVAIFDATQIPYAISRVAPTVYVKKGGYVALSFYIEPDTGRKKVSIRVGDFNFRANELASKFGGGGHEKAAGVAFKGELRFSMFIKEFIDAVGMPVLYVKL